MDAWPVATVGGEAITEAAFLQAYRAYLFQSGQQDAPRLRQHILAQLVNQKLVVREAEADGLTETDTYRFQRETIRQKLLLEAYARHVLYDPLTVAEADLHEMFVRMNTTLNARHLYARTREQADRLYARLQAGEPFEALAREVFADTTLAHRGGVVGPFGFDEMDPAFEEAAYALEPGAVSPPVRTTQGWSIIQLLDRSTAPLLTEAAFAAKRLQVETYVRYRREQAARTRHVEALTATLHTRFDDTTLDELLGQVQGRVLLPDAEALSAWLHRPLVTFTQGSQRHTWTVADFRDRAAYTAEAQRARITSRDDLQAFIQGVLVRTALLTRATGLGLDETPVFRKALQHELEAWVYEQAYHQLVEQVQVSEQAIAQFHAKHPTLFTIPETVRVWEILSDTRAEAEALRGQATMTPFEVLARQHSQRPGASQASGDLGYVTAAQLGLLATPVFQATEGQVLGPFEVQGHYVLLKVGTHLPSRPALLDEVHDQIAAQLLHEARQPFLQAHVEGLRGRFPVDLHEGRLLSLPLSRPVSP
jgi:parvulin-like peptidyl-prolyl isomerase